MSQDQFMIDAGKKDGNFRYINSSFQLGQGPIGRMQGATSKIITQGSLATQMLKEAAQFTSFGGDAPFQNPILQQRVGSSQRSKRNSSFGR